MPYWMRFVKYLREIFLIFFAGRDERSPILVVKVQMTEGMGRRYDQNLFDQYFRSSVRYCKASAMWAVAI